MEKRIESFDEFWPFYVREHSNKLTRQMHFVGTSLAVACVAGALVGRKHWLLLAAPIAGYGPAWISHFFIEKNRPASFKYPLWSLQADLVMWGKMLAGTMDGEVERVLAQNGHARVEETELRPNVAPNGSVN
jgi:hypothetical protein